MNICQKSSSLKILAFLLILLIMFVPVSYAQFCAISLDKTALDGQIQSLMDNEYSNGEKENHVREVYLAFIYDEAIRLVDESDANSFVVFLQKSQDLETLDLAIIYNAFLLKEKYGITDEEIAEGIKNKNLLEIVSEKAGLIGESGAKSLKEKKIQQKEKSLVSSPFLVSSVLAMTLILSTIIKSNVATNEAIGRELAMGSKASVSVVVNEPSTEVFQSEQKQEIIEDFIPAQEPEIPGAPSLEGDDYEKYNKIVPVINKLANEMNFDPLILASIVLTESLGDAKAYRIETFINEKTGKKESLRIAQIKAVFYPTINGVRNDRYNPKYKKHYEKLKAEGKVKTEQEYFKMFEPDRGATEVAFASAIASSDFEGVGDDLFDIETNLRVIIKFLRNRGFNDETDTGLNGAIVANTIVNTNSRTGTTVEGHTERANDYYEQLEKQSDLNNKGIHCGKGSTVCYIETEDVENAKLKLYEIFKKIAEEDGVEILGIDDFFVEQEISARGVRLKTEYNFNPDEVELLYSSNFFVLTDDYSDDLFTLTRKGKISTTATHRLTPKNFASIFSHEYKKGLTGAKSLAYKDYFGNIIVLFWKTGEGSRGIEFHHRDALAYLIKEEADKIEKFAYLTNSLDLLSESDDLNKLFKMISTIRRQDQFPESILERSIGFQLTVDSRGKIKFFDVDSSITSAQINAIDNNELSFDSVMFAEMLGKVNSLIDPSLRNYNGKVRVKSLSVFSKSSNVDVSKYALRLVDLQ